MKRIGITGSSGFVGLHLRFYLYELKDKYEPVLIHADDFLDQEKLAEILKKCDVVVHLAGLNLGEESKIYDTNVWLTKTLLSTLDGIGRKPKIIFLSSTHNTKESAYGRSKRDSQDLVSRWGAKNRTTTFSIAAPHIFGEFGRPYYNSAIATLCYELCENKHSLSSNKASKVNPKAKVELVYVREICSLIVDLFERESSENTLIQRKATLIQKGKEMKLMDVYSILKYFRDEYFSHTIPLLKDRFELHLFNTFRSYLYPHYFPVSLGLKTDQRGTFMELAKTGVGGQTSFSTTYQGSIRGNHYHTRKIERFCVLTGEAIIKLRKLFTNEILQYKVSGKKPVYIDMPTYYTHSVENTASDELLTMFWISEIYDPKDPDTYPEPVHFSTKIP